MKSLLDCMQYLALSNDVGVSSRSIVLRACNIKQDDFGYPHDISDLGRCIRAVNALEIDISCMRGLNLVWDRIVDRWSEILSVQDNYQGFRKIIEAIEDEVCNPYRQKD